MTLREIALVDRRNTAPSLYWECPAGHVVQTTADERPPARDNRLG
jgi:hypothetical protein